MSSGTLPLSTYHRASQVGEGTYGSVLTVYNDDGEEFALKLFVDDDDEDDESPGTDLGALREISCLRLFRDENRHVNIIEMADVQSEWTDDDEQEGAGTAGYLGMTIPLYRDGSLADGLESRTFSRREKVKIAHGLLSAVARLHDYGILHRDIKSDNVLLNKQDDDGDECYYQPILIDFSLAKIIDIPRIYRTADPSTTALYDEPTQHTGEVGTVTYTAPEVVALQPYSFPSDLYSVGVVLLELLLNKPLAAVKNKEAAVMIDAALEKLSPEQPFPNLLRGLLCKDPEQRLTARGALEHSLFVKFDLPVPPPARPLDIAKALPYENEESDGDDAENRSPPSSTKKKGNKKRNTVRERREQMIRKACSELPSASSTITQRAALEYSEQLYQLDDTIDDLKGESQGLLDCVILAYRFFEKEVLDLEELDETDKGVFASWSLEEYVDAEATIFMLMDYCLYPRRLE